MKKTLRNTLATLLVGAGLGVGLASYNYLKDEELIPTPSQYTPNNSEYNVKSVPTPLPEPFNPSQELADRESKHVGEALKYEDLTEDEKKALQERLNSKPGGSTDLTEQETGGLGIEVRNTDQEDYSSTDLKDLASQALGKTVKVIEEKNSQENVGREGREGREYSEPDKKNLNLLYEVLDKINNSGRMPTRDYRNEEFLENGSSVDYSSLLNDVLGEAQTRKRFVPPKNPKGDVKVGTDGKKMISFGSVEEYIVFPSTFVAPYDDTNKDGKISAEEINMEDSFEMKKDEKILLGIYLPARTEKAKKCTVELYNPQGKKVLESNFQIDNELELGKVELEDLVKKYGTGVYTAAFYLNDKCWEVRQFEVEEEKKILQNINKIF